MIMGQVTIYKYIFLKFIPNFKAFKNDLEYVTKRKLPVLLSESCET